ncbi:MAG: transposase [Candidatus Zixiibacteriota bacterium]
MKEKIVRHVGLGVSDSETEVLVNLANAIIAEFDEIIEETRKDEQWKSGFSKDNKVNETQIMLALITTNCGMPISYRVLPGNIYEGHTLLDMVGELKQSYNVAKVTIVADRAMFTENSLQKMEHHDFNFIVAAKLKTVRKGMKNRFLRAAWDGLHGIITNNMAEKPEDLLSRYRSLWQIEEAFRVSKHDLRMRPIYHWTEERIRAHISICFIAYTLIIQGFYHLSVQKTMPMSFERLRNELLHVQSSILAEKDINK